MCKREAKRSTTFRQTLNPFNKVKSGPRAGQPKTRDDIMAELKVQAQEWNPNSTRTMPTGGLVKLQMWSVDDNDEPDDLLGQVDVSDEQFTFACANRHAAHHLTNELKDAMES